MSSGQGGAAPRTSAAHSFVLGVWAPGGHAHFGVGPGEECPERGGPAEEAQVAREA